MEVLRRDPDAAELRLTRGELAIINNALNEICHGIELSEFATRIGAGRDEAKRLLTAIGALLRGLSPGP
jgi:hypothetical protein